MSDIQPNFNAWLSDIKPNQKIIALDYDGTCTTNLRFWTNFGHQARLAGYVVLLVTMRTAAECQDINRSLAAAVDHVVPTSRRAKRAFLSEHGIHPAIWIDDMPEAIFQDFK